MLFPMAICRRLGGLVGVFIVFNTSATVFAALLPKDVESYNTSVRAWRKSDYRLYYTTDSDVSLQHSISPKSRRLRLADKTSVRAQAPTHTNSLSLADYEGEKVVLQSQGVDISDYTYESYALSIARVERTGKKHTADMA